MSVQVAETSFVEQLPQCGSCGRLNDKDASSCARCGESLKVGCPNCKVVNESENRACKKCGVSIGDAALVRQILHDAQLALARGETQHAEQLVCEAKVYWSSSEEVKAVLQRVVQQTEQEEQLEEQLSHTVDEKRFCKAAKLLTTCRRIGRFRETQRHLERSIKSAFAAAERHVDRARAFERQGKVGDAIDAYSDAIRECQDYPEALDGLAKFPPEALAA